MILQGSRRFVEVLEHCAALGLPGWYLAAGCVTQTVWNHLTGRPVDGGIRGYDLLRLVVRTSLVLAPTDPRSTRTPGPGLRGLRAPGLDLNDEPGLSMRFTADVLLAAVPAVR